MRPHNTLFDLYSVLSTPSMPLYKNLTRETLLFLHVDYKKYCVLIESDWTQIPHNVDSLLPFMKMSCQCSRTDRKTTETGGVTGKGTENKRESIIISIYKTLILFYLIYCMQFSSLHHKQGVLELEEIQKGKKELPKRWDVFLYEQIINRRWCVFSGKEKMGGDTIAEYVSFEKPRERK